MRRFITAFAGIVVVALFACNGNDGQGGSSTTRIDTSGGTTGPDTAARPPVIPFSPVPSADAIRFITDYDSLPLKPDSIVLRRIELGRGLLSAISHPATERIRFYAAMDVAEKRFTVLLQQKTRDGKYYYFDTARPLEPRQQEVSRVFCPPPRPCSLRIED